MGDDIEGSRKDGSNGAGSGRNVQIGGAVSVNLWKKKLGIDQVYAQGPDGIPPSGSVTDHRDGGEAWGRQRVVISSSRGGNGLCGAPTHQSIHKMASDDHSGEGVIPACLCIVH